MSPPHGRGSRECREIFARLSEYLDGELDSSWCSQVDEHMADCPPCQAFLESMRRTIDLTRDLPGTALPEELKQGLLRAYRDLKDEH